MFQFPKSSPPVHYTKTLGVFPIKNLFFYPLVFCSSELTVSRSFNAVTSGATLHLFDSGYFGTYISSLSVDKHGYSWWENGDKAIWWQNGAWNFGPLSEMGKSDVNEVQIKSGSYSPCPHPTTPNYGPDQIAWMYKDTSGVWTTAGRDIRTISGTCLT